MSNNTPISPSPLTQAGFSEAQKLEALTLKARLQSGENIPRAELIAFLLTAEKDLSANKVKLDKPPTPKPAKAQDVDFF